MEHLIDAFAKLTRKIDPDKEDDFDDDDDDDDNDDDDDDDDDNFHRGYWHYTPKQPKTVRGGIKAQSSSRGFSKKWWGHRWLKLLEQFQVGARLARGRSYARRGQVMDLDIGKGLVTARVQGTRSTPYRVKIGLKAFGEGAWDTIVARLAEEPVYAARLLRNEMPEEIEALFRGMGFPLFPERHADLKTDCSCPDWSNPCKHIAAVYYLLAEAFDEYPFLLFRLRGMELDDFLGRLRGAHGIADEEEDQEQDIAVPLPAAHDLFWRRGAEDTAIDAGVTAAEQPAQLPLRLGSIPFWRSEQPFHAAMRNIYATVSNEALDLIGGGEPQTAEA